MSLIWGLIGNYSPLLSATITAYVLLVIFWIVMDNRPPKTTVAWILAFLLFPIAGLLTYIFFGRDWKAFSKRNKLAQQELGGALTPMLKPLVDNEINIIDELQARGSLVYKQKLMHLVKNNTFSTLTCHNRVEILQDAHQKYPRLLEDIEEATDHIHFLYYIWHEDEWTRELKDILIRKAQQGVKIRALIDTQGLDVSRQYRRELQAAGVEFYRYLDYTKPWSIHTINYRNHRKIVVVDGRIGYLGGLNLSQEHLDGGKHFTMWRDTHCRMEGDAAKALQTSFVVSWFNTVGQRLTDPRYFPEVDAGDDFVPVQITNSGPDSQWAAIRQQYFYMISSAVKRIYLASPFFIPDESIQEALRAAALAGIEVKMMFAPRGTTYTIPYWAGNTYFADMARAGAEIYLYQKGYFHPKTLVIDSTRAVCSIGTANMDIRSFSINYETNAVIYDEHYARQLEDSFEADMADCQLFDLEAYENQAVFFRFRDSVCRLASPLL